MATTTKEELYNQLAEVKGELEVERAEHEALKEVNADLAAEHEALKGRVAVLEADATMAEPSDRVEFASVVKALVGSDAYADALQQAKDEAGKPDLFGDDDSHEAASAALAVLLDHAAEDTKPTAAQDAMADRIAMLQADLARVEIERNDARQKLAIAQEKLQGQQSLHGAIDGLKAPY